MTRGRALWGAVVDTLGALWDEWATGLAVVVAVAAFVFLIGSLLVHDEENLGREEIDGVECIVARNGFGRVRAISCDWGPQ